MIAREMADKVCELARMMPGCTTLVGTVDLSLPGAEVSMKAHLVYGFVAAGRQGSAVLMAKRLITVAASGEVPPAGNLVKP